MRIGAWLLVLAMVVGCGKDASIRLTRPEVEAPKTKRVNFSLTTSEGVPVSAKITLPSETIELAKAGQRSFPAPIGDNLHVEIALPEGFEIDWNVVPGSNSDFDSGSPTILIKNIQEDIRVSALVRRIPLKDAQKVYFSIATLDAGDITATFGKNKATAQSYQFLGAGQRVLEVGTGEDFHAALKLPGGWEVERWEMSEGGDADLGNKREITVSRVQGALRLTAHVRKLPTVNFRVRAMGTSNFFGEPGSGAVKWAIYPPDTEKIPEEFSVLGQEGGVSTTGREADSSKIKPYANGSIVVMRFEFVDSAKERHYFKSQITLDDHTMVDFDFSPFINRAWTPEGVNVYDVIGAPQKGGSLK